MLRRVRRGEESKKPAEEEEAKIGDEMKDEEEAINMEDDIVVEVKSPCLCGSKLFTTYYLLGYTILYFFLKFLKRKS